MRAAAERRAAAAAAIPAAPQGQPPSPPSTIILVSSDEEEGEAGPAAAAGPAPRARPAPAPARFDPLARTGFGLIAVPGLSPQWNAGALGVRLADLAPAQAPHKARPSLVWASNFMLDPHWVLESIPAVRAADRLIVCQGAWGRVAGDAPGALAAMLAAMASDLAAGSASATLRAGARSGGINTPTAFDSASLTVAEPTPEVKAYGVHHTKALFLVYPTGCRFICLTGNFVPGEYEGGLTQAAWWQDFPRKDAASPRPVPGGFEESFASYVGALASRGLPGARRPTSRPPSPRTTGRPRGPISSAPRPAPTGEVPR